MEDQTAGLRKRPGMSATRYALPIGRMAEHVPAHPERTSLENELGIFGEVRYRVWPSEEAMTKAIEKARRGENRSNLRPYSRNAR